MTVIVTILSTFIYEWTLLFYVQIIEGDLRELALLDLSAIVGLHQSESYDPIYVGVVGLHNDRYQLAAQGLDRQAAVDRETLMARWDGVALVPWKNIIGYHGVIPGGAPDASVILLKQLLWEIGYSHLTIDDRFDAATRRAVMELQARHGLAVDGVVGNLTKIVLYNEKGGLPIPHLRR